MQPDPPVVVTKARLDALFATAIKPPYRELAETYWCDYPQDEAYVATLPSLRKR